MLNSPHQKQQEEDFTIDWELEQQKYHLNKIMKINTKYHYRIFMGCFKSYVYQRLVDKINKKQEIEINNTKQEWPYQFLLQKKYKTEHQLLEIQFINMCAEKIQSIFKGYLTRKRHQLAINKLKIFIQKAQALIKGWKVRRILRCFKHKQLISIKSKQQQIAKQINSLELISVKSNPKRLQYLKNSLRDQLFHFHRKFKEIYNNGMWVYEAKLIQKTQPLPFKKWKKVNNVNKMKENNYVQQLHENEFINNHKQQSKQIKEDQPIKPKRVRQMRNNQASKKNSNPISQQQKQISENTNNTQNKSSFNTRSSMNQIQDRPIMAKGSYSYNFNEANQKQDQQNQKQNPKIQEIKNQGDIQKENEKKTELRKNEKKKLEKRKFYDPKKAIQQQKKRKKQELQKIATQETKQPTQSQKIIEKKQTSTIVTKSQKQKNNDLKSQKSLKFNEKQENRSTVNIPKVKQKAQAKIDCWGNRKTVVKKTQSYKQNKIIYNITSQNFKEKQSQLSQIQKQTVQQKKSMSFVNVIEKKIIKGQQNIDEPRSPKRQQAKILTHDALLKKIAQKRQKEKQRYQYSEQRIKKMIQIQKNREQVQNIKRNLEKNRYQKNNPQPKKYEEEVRHRMSSLGGQIGAAGYRERARGSIDEQKRKEMAKQIQQLEEAYNLQYKNRLQILLPKLGLLSAAKQKQKRFPIAVITSDDEIVYKTLQQNTSQQIFWQNVTKMQKQFKQNIQMDRN